MTSGRLEKVDYLKSVFIVLMVIFHLIYVGDKYPYIKQIVYTFHMPAFLIISGYLTNIHKNGKSFFSLFRASLLSVVPIVILCSDSSNLDRFTLAGGNNNLFGHELSPVFTIITRAFVPYFSFDSTGICFTLVVVTFVIGGCMGIVWTMDKIKRSKWFCGKKQMLSV